MNSPANLGVEKSGTTRPDVVDIAVTALISDLRVSAPVIGGPASDNVNQNDMAYNKGFPYEFTPQNGRIPMEDG